MKDLYAVFFTCFYNISLWLKEYEDITKYITQEFVCFFL